MTLQPLSQERSNRLKKNRHHCQRFSGRQPESA